MGSTYVSDREVKGMPISVAGCPLRWYNTACISPRGKRSSSSLSRVAGLIHLRGSLSRIRARLRSTTLQRTRDPWRYRSWIPIYSSFLPFCSLPLLLLLLSADDITASILQLIPLFRSSSIRCSNKWTSRYFNHDLDKICPFNNKIFSYCKHL